MVRTILIARHGFRLSWTTNTWASPTGIEKDPPLAAYGVAQAADLAKFIKSLPEEQRPTLLFSSPYYRCLQTSNPASEILGVPIYVEHGLSEWYSPVVPGTGELYLESVLERSSIKIKRLGLHPRPHSAESLKQYFPLIDTSWESIYYPDRRGETVKGVHDRCGEFLDALIARIEGHPTLSKHNSILLVSHAATCAALVRHLVKDRELPLRVGTCTLSILERGGDSGDQWVPQGDLAGAKFLPGGVERDWGFEDAIFKDDQVIEDPGVCQDEDEDSGFSGLVPDKARL
ncbi:histidine phosphatase superfamily [Rhizoctonia solani]|nr:histidine phosphatase superfamily [Rhizoctonia solani]